MKISFLLLCLSLLLFVCYFFFSVCMSGGVVSLFVFVCLFFTSWILFEGLGY